MGPGEPLDPIKPCSDRTVRLVTARRRDVKKSQGSRDELGAAAVTVQGR